METSKTCKLCGKEAEVSTELIGIDLCTECAEEIHENALEGALEAYSRIVGEDFIGNFKEAYEGMYESDEHFAKTMADNLGTQNLSWPHDCIDWERAASELMYDYSEENGYYFRNL